jgi:hypothetical protein
VVTNVSEERIASIFKRVEVFYKTTRSVEDHHGLYCSCAGFITSRHVVYTSVSRQLRPYASEVSLGSDTMIIAVFVAEHYFCGSLEDCDNSFHYTNNRLVGPVKFDGNELFLF